MHDRAADILRPSGALAWLDEIAAWVAGWQRTDRPAVRRPAGLIFAADHGVAAATKVSAYPTGVTEAMLAAYREGRSTINAFARIAGAEVTAIDVGVGRPTGDIRFESGADRATLRRGRADRHRRGRRDSTATSSCSARWASATRHRRRRSPRPSPVARRRPGSAEAPASTTRASPASAPPCRKSVRRIAGITDPIEILREVGGAELVAIAAAAIAARHRSIPVVLDGYVVTAAVLPLLMRRPDGARPLHRRPLLGRARPPPAAGAARQAAAARPRHAPRRGVGAMAAVPLIAMACAGITEVPTFAEWFGE